MTAIRHTVAFALPYPQGSREEEAFLTEARRLTAIAGVEDFVVLRALDEGAELPLTLSMRFADRAAYDAYTAHPSHVAFVADRWLPTVTAFVESDYGIEDPASGP